MRCLPALLAVVFAACGEPPPPAPDVPTAATAPPGPTTAPAATAEIQFAPLAARLLGGDASDADRTLANAHGQQTVSAILAAASRGSPQQQGRAPAVLAALGPTALPGLATALQHADPTQRRIAALTLLQLGDGLHRDGTAATVLPALRAAAADPDLAVRAAAELAVKRATGDTSDLDKSRAEHEAALRQGR